MGKCLPVLTLLALCLGYLVSANAQPAENTYNNRYANHSVLASGKWFKVGVSETGIQRLGYSDLASLGMDVDRLDPRNLRVYHNGGGLLNERNADPRYDDLKEVPIVVYGEADGKFDSNDYILFYARGPVTWRYVDADQAFAHTPNAYDDYSYAFITADLGAGKRIETVNQPSETASATVAVFQDYQVYEEDNYNLISAGRTYYSDILDGTVSLTKSFSFPNAMTNRDTHVSVNLAGRNFQQASFELYVNSTLLKTFPISVTGPGSDKAFAYPVSGSAVANTTSSTVKVTLKHQGYGSTSIGYVDYIAVNAWRSLKFYGDEMCFRNPEASDETRVYNYQLSGAAANVQVWNVTDSVCPVIVKGQLSGSVFSFKTYGNPKNEFIAFNGSSCHTPSLVGTVSNQDLHGDRNYDYLMVVYPDFLEQAQRLKAIHAEHDPDLRIKIVTPQAIYNEFSCGAKDVTAIRDYCRMLYHDATPLRYLLLFGDASYDFKNRSEVVDFVPSYEAPQATDIHTSIVTDDYFCFMGEDEGAITGSTPDIGAGRFPVSTVEQATQMVTKVENYLAANESTMAPWRNNITFMCDDAESNQFIDHSESYASLITTTGGEQLVVDKIYLDAYSQESTPNGQLAPMVNAAVNNRMEKGALVLNYVGHGGEVQLAEERILQRADVNSWRNGPKYPLMITGTCEFSRYDDHTRTSLGEYAFLNQYGGMIAMFTTARVTYGPNNKRFISKVYRHLFEIEDGKRMRLGDVYRLAKSEGLTSDRMYVFFGDPALRLPMPTWTVETTVADDTIKALQPTTLEGVVKDLDGQVASSFNGVVYVSVYDKETTYTTKGDENTPQREFKLHNSLVFNGKTTVENGRFSIDFIVPRDISYRYGNGMVSYYATDYVNEASGKFEDFIIGGFYDDAITDETPPTVQLYIDDERFTSGGITGDSPLLLAYIEDDSGINTTGAGIGHDIVATLSGPDNQSYLLNDYFESDMGDQGKGKVSFRMRNLQEGDYILSLKVWDIFNNSGVSMISFKVRNSESMALEDPYCAPNPVRNGTYFSFGHNQIGNNMDVQIQIYDILGRQVAVLKEQVSGTSMRTNPIYWDGRSKGGDKLPGGVYVYTITATNDQNDMATIASKLIVIP
ncbi:MAG: type IX secretion system sortase PorU [Bacteroidales bacterium]|nr:type IX secretion system sortase PorU [Bacteroidales bacterium]